LEKMIYKCPQSAKPIAAAAKDVYDDNENKKEQLKEWFGDGSAHERKCDALARALRVRHAVMDYVYETRLELPCPHASSFTSLDAYIDATRDAPGAARVRGRGRGVRARAAGAPPRRAAAPTEGGTQSRRSAPPSSLLASSTSRRKQTARRSSLF
jgi:hypothetical protein